MSENKKNVPKRRFKEFENSEGWEQRKFDEEVEFYSGLTYSPNDVSDKGTLVLRSSNVKNGEIVDADNVYVNSEAVNSSNVKEGDIIVVVRNGSRSLIGKHAHIKKKMDKTVIGAFMTGIRSNQSSFINALMDTQQFSVEVEKNLGATINQITNGMFREMRFMFPDIEEQNKIGNFFKNLDNLIALHQRKLEKMKALKKAYLTDMFPAEGEGKPKIRFTGFTDDWEQCKLNEKVDIIGTGKSKFISNIQETEGKPYAVLGSTSVISYDNEYDYSGDFVLTARVGANAGDLYRYSGNVKISDNTVFLQGKNLDFVFFLLTKFNLKNLSFGTGQPLIKASELSNLDLMFPSQVEESKQIGTFFNNLDNLITVYQHKLEKLQNIKKAYLNEMFI